MSKVKGKSCFSCDVNTSRQEPDPRSMLYPQAFKRADHPAVWYGVGYGG
jgi:hypothetical protein